MRRKKNSNSAGTMMPHARNPRNIIGIILLVLAIVGLVLYGLMVRKKPQPPALAETQIADEIQSTSGVIMQVRDDGALILELHLPDNKGGTVRRVATLTSQTPILLFTMADGIQTAMITSSDLRAGQKIEIDADKDIAANETIGVLQLLVIAF